MSISEIPHLKTRIFDCDSKMVPDFIFKSTNPIILKNLVSDWPIVRESRTSPKNLASYLKIFYNGKHVSVFQGNPVDNGNYFYSEDISSFNFKTLSLPIDNVIDSITSSLHDENSIPYYIASCTIDNFFPNLLKENYINFPPSVTDGFSENGPPLINLWLGNKSRSACHFDVPSNIACCISGKRRFTLLPPSQITNLYPGPYDLTPGGQVISMVDFDNPDYTIHPKFERALENIQIAELDPGDALFIPSMWWHQVEALSPINAMINYWWNSTPRFLGQAKPALEHSMMTIRNLPKEQKMAWKELFDYYVFSDNENAINHLPQHSRGILGDLTEIDARRLRAKLLRFLNR